MSGCSSADYSCYQLHYLLTDDTHALVALGKGFDLLDVLVWGPQSEVYSQHWGSQFLHAVVGSLISLSSLGSGIGLGKENSTSSSSFSVSPPLPISSPDAFSSSPSSSSPSHIHAIDVDTAALELHPDKPLCSGCIKESWVGMYSPELVYVLKRNSPTSDRCWCNRSPPHQDVAPRTECVFSLPLESPLNVQGMTVLDIQDWFRARHTIFDHFFINQHHEWNGPQILQLSKLDGDSLQEKLLDSGCNWPWLRSYMVECIYNLRHCQEKLEIPTSPDHSDYLIQLFEVFQEDMREEFKTMRKVVESQTVILQQGDRLIPRLMLLHEKDWNGAWNSLCNFSLLKKSYVINFVCECALMKRRPGDPRTPCTAPHPGYIIELTRQSVAKHLPWMKKTVRLLLAIVKVPPLVGDIGTLLGELGVPSDWVNPMSQTNNTILHALDLVTPSVEDCDGGELDDPSKRVSSSSSSSSGSSISSADADVLSKVIRESDKRKQEATKLSAEALARTMSGLHLVNHGGSYYWLCEKHKKEVDKKHISSAPLSSPHHSFSSSSSSSSSHVHASHPVASPTSLPSSPSTHAHQSSSSSSSSSTPPPAPLSASSSSSSSSPPPSSSSSHI